MKLRHLTILVIAAATLLTAAPPQRDKHVPGKLVVQTRRGADLRCVANALGRNGALPEKSIPQLNIHVLRVPEPALDNVAAALMKTGLFTFAERDHFLSPSTTVANDPYFVSQWHLPAIQAPNAWDITKGSSSVIIAVIDSGADWNHPDLQPNLVTGWNFLTGTSSTQDNAGHGTEVSGTAAAVGNNGI